MEINSKLYLPPHIYRIEEYQAITACYDTLLIKLWDDMQRIYNNQYLDTLDYEGCQRLEQIMGIMPPPGENIEIRRKRIKINWLNDIPYTLNSLREIIRGQVGEEFEIDISGFKNYELSVYIIDKSGSLLKNIFTQLKQVIPANLVLKYNGKYPGVYKVKINYNNAIHFRTGFYPRYNLAFLDLDNTWKLDGRLLNSYDGDSYLDFYPVSLRMQAPVRERVETGQRLRLFSGAREEIGLNTGYKIQTDARASPETAEQFTIKTAVKEQSGAGPVRVTNLNVLDNEWTLNDSRKLNGGLTIL